MSDMITITNLPIVQASTSIITATIAVLAFVIANQRENRRLRDSVDSLWREYENLCFEHPEFASPNRIKNTLNMSAMEFDGDGQKIYSI
jgi:hypothetical protein